MNDKALDRYIEQKTTADEKIGTILDFVSNHCDTDPESVNWSHVGNMSHLNSELDSIMEFLGI